MRGELAGGGGFVRVVWVLSAIITTACAPQQSVRDTAPADPLTVAAARISSGDFAGAAVQYQQLAQSLPEPAASSARLQAVLLLQDLGDYAAGAALMPGAPPTEAGARTLFELAAAMQQLEQHAAEPASALLNALDASPLDAYQKGLYLRCLGRAQLALGDFANAAVNLTNAEPFPLPRNRRTELTHAIWQALAGIPEAGLAGQLNPANRHVPGWIDLVALANRSRHDPAALSAEIAAWQLRYPAHPANEILVEELLEQAEEIAAPPQRIALLLPFEGSLGGAAEAIRDGFIAMRFFAGNAATAPAVAPYSVTPADINQIFDQAVAEGAGFVVGPLEKPALEALLKRTDLKIPVLALNALEPAPGSAGPARPGFYQFGLRPEDEAIDAANRAWADGLRRMAAIVPNTELGSRILRAFTAQWQALGGTLLDEARFVSEVDSYAAAVRQMFGLRQSEARAAALRRLLQRNLIFEARRRPDIDGIMLVAFPVDARQILPQFRYFGADQIPIYSTSHIFAGQPNPSADQDLDGVTFADMPWVLGTRDAALKRIIASRWRNDMRNYQRFYAFGADAYRIIPYLGQLRAQPTMRLAGATGQLWMDSAGLVRRDLAWAKFRGGLPSPIPGPSP